MQTLLVKDLVILGAGVSGLTAALRCHQAGLAMHIVDKGRGPGGRLATRRLALGHADHGAPCFTLEREDVRQLWQQALQNLALRPAPLGMPISAHVCPDGINRLAKNLARDLPLSLEQQIIAIRREGDSWLLSARSGQHYQARQVLITCPLPQAAELFTVDQPELGGRLRGVAESLQYRPQWTAIISANAEKTLQTLVNCYQLSPAPGLSSLHEQIPGQVWVVQADQEFSTQYVEEQPEMIVTRIGDALRAQGLLVENQQIQAHRWRYARVANPLQQAFLTWDDAPGLCWAGDFCLASTVIEAAASGLFAAEHLIARQSTI